MNLLSRAGEYLRVENDEFDSEPTSIGVSTEDYADDADYEISGRFPDEKDDDRVLPPSKRVLVDRSSEMQSVIEDVFDTVRDNVTVSGDAYIHSIHISSTGDAEDMMDDWSFYTSETADARVFIGVETDTVPDDVQETLLGAVVDDLQELDDELTADYVRTVEYLFSDMDELLLQTVRGQVDTPTPHKHYSNVDSVEEYVDVVADDASEFDDLMAQETYDVFYRAEDGETAVGGDMKQVGEDIMRDFIDSTFQTEWEYIVEAEGIYFGEFEDGLLDESMKYYVNIPIVGDDIGVTR